MHHALYSSNINHCVRLDHELHLFCIPSALPVGVPRFIRSRSWELEVTKRHDSIDIHSIGVMVVNVVPDPEISKRDTKQRRGRGECIRTWDIQDGRHSMGTRTAAND